MRGGLYAYGAGMPCPECAHCAELARRADLRLPPLPLAGGRAGVNRGFYLAFAAAYDLARTRSQTPGVLLRASNPGLSASQCREYLKRARALGFVSTPARVTSSARVVEATPPPSGSPGGMTDEAREWLARARRVEAAAGH